MKPKLIRHPKEYPVYWETYDGRPAGYHKARVMEVLPYTGRYKQFFNFVYRLHDPNTKKGYSDMAVQVN